MVVDGEFVGAHGQAAPLFEPVDAAFRDVALTVDLFVERGRSAAVTAAAEPVCVLVGWLRDRRADPVLA